MIIELGKDVWLSFGYEELNRVEICYDCYIDEKPAIYFVKVYFANGREENSTNFRTFEEARACAEKFIDDVRKE